MTSGDSGVSHRTKYKYQTDTLHNYNIEYINHHHHLKSVGADTVWLGSAKPEHSVGCIILRAVGEGGGGCDNDRKGESWWGNQGGS